MYKSFIILIAFSLFLWSCSEDEEQPSPQINIDVPEDYSFERNGNSSVSFSGQTTRILMSEELVSSMLEFNLTETTLLEMYRNEDGSGGDVNPFENPDLNSATKSIREKVAASFDFFNSNASEANVIKTDFEEWISAQVKEVYPNENQVASPGNPGQLADGSSTRYVNAQGLEYNQLVNKGLIGALMLDQAINNYLSADYLNRGTNVENNNDEVLSDGANYTVMEHLWDEAYGYFYGTSSIPEDPNATIGLDDNFLNKYIGRMEGDVDFAGIADRIFNAFKLGRAAIVAKDYELRDQQAAIIQSEASKIIAVRAVYYLQQAKAQIPSDRQNYSAYGPLFHDLSEGYGFIYSLRFTKNTQSGEALFSRNEVDQLLLDLMGDGPNGLWDIQASTLDEMSETIAAKFNFSVTEAAQ